MHKLRYYLLIFILSAQFTFPARAQIGYSPVIDSLIQDIHFDSLMLMLRQLSGDTSVIIQGVTDSIKTRHSNHAGNEKAAQWIFERFDSFGLNVEFQSFSSSGKNVIASKTGVLFPDKQFIICAHYDDMPNASLAPGADDNGSGVCAVMEAARLATGFDFPYTLKFIAFDEEEQGLWGSRAYADTAYKYGHDILGVLNLDMIAWDANADNQVSIASNLTSMPLMADNIACMRIYRPELSPHLFYVTASDHSRFWNRSYKAILTIEDWKDFNPYYHSVNDHFGNIHHDYFHRMTQAAVATILTWGWDFRMELQHIPLESTPYLGSRMVTLVAATGNFAMEGPNRPRLYYRTDNGPYDFVFPSYYQYDTIQFIIPELPAGSKVSYYFAVPDSLGQFVTTLPKGGRGADPPGIDPPSTLYTYYLLQDETQDFCATGLPFSISANSTVYKSIEVLQQGMITDVNVLLSINHNRMWDLDIYLISPAGRVVELTTKNGYQYSSSSYPYRNYVNTIMDDQANDYIHEHMAPFTGSFKPEQPLSSLTDTTMAGTWQLMMVNRGSLSGQLTEFCLEIGFNDKDVYVDGTRLVSGDGLSWSTAFKTISEAAVQEPPAGTIVFIRPGVYHEDLNIISNGEEVIGLTTGIQLSDQNKIIFPPGTDLSGVDLVNHPGEYYAYIYRSRNLNNGFYQVINADLIENHLIVTGAGLIDESGMAGDSSRLSAVVGRPVIYSKCAVDPLTERVVVDAAQSEDIYTILYIGDPVGDGSQDALPADFNIADGLDLTGSAYGGGVHLQSSSFNVFCNSRIYNSNGPGIYVNGNDDHPAFFNIISENEIFNTPYEGIYIGAGGQPKFYNHTHYTHLLNNSIFCSGNDNLARLENAIDIKDHNTCSLLQGNFIHDFNLITEGNGALNIGQETNYSFITQNVFRNIGENNAGTNAVIMIHSDIQGIEIVNNVIYNSEIDDNNVYALRIDGTGHDSSYALHNTIYNVKNGFLLEDYTGDFDFSIINNIIHINENYFTHWGGEGNFTLSNNFYPTDPALFGWMPYYTETGRQIGAVEFIDPLSGNFSLTINNDKAVITGKAMTDQVKVDFAGTTRDSQMPDIGAYELKGKMIWLGEDDTNWHNPLNWDKPAIPDSTSNVVITPGLFSPVITANGFAGGIIIKPGANIAVPSAGLLRIFKD